MRIFYGSANDAIDRALAYLDHRILFVGGSWMHIDVLVSDALREPQYAHIRQRPTGQRRNVYELLDQRAGAVLGTLWTVSALRIDSLRGVRFDTAVIADGVSLTDGEQWTLHSLVATGCTRLPDTFAARMRAKRIGKAIG